MHCSLILIVTVTFLGIVFGAPKRAENDDESRIINGTRASPGAHKYICSIQKHEGDSIVKFCGGSLIHPQWLLTAAHCVDDYVHSGDIRGICAVCGVTHAYNFLVNEEERAKAQILPVSRIYMHEKFISVGRGWDIALLKLTNPAKLNRYVQLIELAPLQYTPYNQWAMIMGWGETDPDDLGGDDTWDLREAWNLVLDPKECREKYGWNILDHHICAFYEGSSTCMGDSGGPLVHTGESGKPRQIGLVSYGSSRGCGVRPTVFTWVAYFKPWIQDVMSGKYD